MRNENYACLAILLTFATAARSTPGSWFSPSACAADPPLGVEPGARLMLSVHYQPGLPPHDVVVALGEDRAWRVPLEEWRQWTSLPPHVEQQPDGDVLAVLDGDALALRLDACTSELWVDVDPHRHYETNLGRPPPNPVTPAGYGGFLNVDFAYGGLAGRNAIATILDMGGFGPDGAARSDFFVGNDAVRRLDTYWIHDQPGNAIRLRVGDSITDAAAWESPVRFGGVQWGTDFSLQPDRITFPLPSISGSAAVASTAQLYVNGVQQSQQSLQPGQFRFDSVPTLTGAGDLTVVLRDSLGREQAVTQPFYASPSLLAPGLDSETVESGFLRENYAAIDDRYSQPFAAATLQHGFTNTLTGLLRGSVSARRQLTGVEGDYLLSPIGVFTLSAAGSHTEAGSGAIGTLAFVRQATDLSLSVSRRAATREYGDLGRDPGTLHFSDTARLSLNMHRAGIGSIVYISEQPWVSSTEGVGARVAGVAWNGQAVGSLSVYASVLRTLSGGGTSLVLGFAMILGRGTSGSMQIARDGSSGAEVAIQHAPPERLGWSYSAVASSADEGLRQVQAVLTTERGSVGGGWAGVGGGGSPSLVAQTGFAFFDGDTYWTRPVQNSFAVVDLGGFAGVGVYRENQLIGTTDSQGRLLVPDLLPFSVNRLSIDDTALPVTAGLQIAAEQVAPPANAGVALHFRVDERPALRLTLVGSSGRAIPAGAILMLDGHALPLPVGYDGLVYAPIADGPHTLAARWTDGACRARLQVDNGHGTLGVCEDLRP